MVIKHESFFSYLSQWDKLTFSLFFRIGKRLGNRNTYVCWWFDFELSKNMQISTMYAFNLLNFPAWNSFINKMHKWKHSHYKIYFNVYKYGQKLKNPESNHKLQMYLSCIQIGQPNLHATNISNNNNNNKSRRKRMNGNNNKNKLIRKSRCVSFWCKCYTCAIIFQ